MNPVLGVVDVEHDAPGGLPEAVAEHFDHRRHHALERNRTRQVFQSADGRLRAQIGAALGQPPDRHLERRIAARFEQAASAARRALQANPRFSVPCFLQTAALAHLGRASEAAASARHLFELQPDFTIASLVESKFTSTEYISMLAEGLSKAGVP
jgi:hypothetical protein